VTPKISVITATYNNSGYIGAAIESILSQSFKDFEYIIVNDASQDETTQILEYYAKIDSRILLMTNAKNMGRSMSRNRALHTAKSEWIVIFDGDDISDPLRLEKQMEFANKSPRVDYFGTGCYFEDKVTLASIDDREFVPKLSHGTISWELCWNYPFHHSSTMGKRKLIIDSGGYPQSYPVCEDISLWMELAKHGACFANIPDKLITYRINPAPKHYALNQILAQKLHRQYVENLIGEKISNDVFEIIWQTNYSEDIFIDKSLLTPKNVFNAYRILIKTFENITVNTTLLERKLVENNLLYRLRTIFNLNTFDNDETRFVYQFVYDEHLIHHNISKKIDL
jgi:glycosyltransferase involved in cell wall biosynthesis